MGFMVRGLDMSVVIRADKKKNKQTQKAKERAGSATQKARAESSRSRLRK